MLGMMKGGYNLETLIELLEDEELGSVAAEALSDTILVFGFFDKIKELSRSNSHAKKVMESWANAEWFTGSPELPDSMTVTVFKVPGEVNTDDLSPASRAASRHDIPLHALHMLENRYKNAISEIEELKKKRHPIAL